MTKYVYVVMTYNNFCEPVRVNKVPLFSSEKAVREYLEKHKYSADLPSFEYLWIKKTEDIIRKVR